METNVRSSQPRWGLVEQTEEASKLHLARIRRRTYMLGRICGPQMRREAGALGRCKECHVGYSEQRR